MSDTTPNNGNIGNAVHILAPGTTWKLHEPGDRLSSLEWMDDPELRPTDAAILAKVADLDEFVIPTVEIDDDAEAQAQAAASGRAKLAALGLTDDEINALLGA